MRRQKIGWILAAALPVLVALAAPHPAWARRRPRVDLSAVALRPIDGFGSNEAHPEWGAANTPLLRLMAPAYDDGVSAPAGAGRPSARAVSNAVAAQGGSIPNAEGLSGFLFQWGQFVDHDIDLTGAARPTEHLDIAVPAGDLEFDPLNTGVEVIPFMRSLHVEVGGVREQVNEVTAFIDASNVYGSDAARSVELRSTQGRMRMSRRRLPMRNVDHFPNAPDPGDPTMFLAGDVRANEQVGLTSMHALFVREHNRVLKMLRARHWLPRGTSYEMRYQMTRAVVAAEIQAITYKEFLPALLGPDALKPYAGYDPAVNPSIANLFSTAAYRFGHSTLPTALLRRGRNGREIRAGDLPLRQAFFAPQEVVRHGIDPVLRGLALQPIQEIDPFVVDDVRNFLFGPPAQGGFDLVALNIQRGRDHGLPSYNEARVAFGLPPAATFADVTGDPEIQARLASVYPSVDDVDVWVGGLAEDHHPGAVVGELFFRVIRDQFERLRDGDRFWYQITLPEPLLSWVEEQTLADVIRRDTRVGRELADDVFHVRP
jgi:peroxidase